ncbi:hypothetical protein BDP27DRAFT_1336057 [Rhodocollybia butyracea]|uniref:DUF6533 domain-containing protein n=1 Tax=Rhodocollybia butyracea TaxID=206335 RepID=A0A9P5PGH5_9AGAR|nr:hypothetical protein BDP27DRAFT_1336057 [Rhodocollybia butyracea]
MAITALWTYEYVLTIGDEMQFVWTSSKNLVFWLFILNRYLALIIIIVTNVAYFTPLFTQEVPSRRCYRYGFVEQIETILMATIAETLVLIRVYALSGRKRWVLFAGVPFILVQWGLLLYQDSQYVNGTSNLAVILFAKRELDTSALPPLPPIDAYRLCIAIPSLSIVQAGEAFLSLFIVYDGLAVAAIIYFLVQRDGLLYFAVMFASNFVWLMMSLYARTGLAFMQNQISSIMVNRVTINLKKVSEERIENVSWTGGRPTKGVGPVLSNSTPQHTNVDVELDSFSIKYGGTV